MDLTDMQWTQIESYMRATVAQLCGEWGIPEDRLKLVFRNTRQSQCRELWMDPDGTLYRHNGASEAPGRERAASLRMGWWDAGDTFITTMREYKQCQHLVKGKPTGVEALGYLVRHEFAHAMVWILGVADHEKPHGPGFVSVYEELLECWELWQLEVYA